MRRRTFIAGVVTGAAIIRPSVIRAVEEHIRSIGALLAFTPDDPLAIRYLGLFRDRLRELGWDERRNLRIESRWAGDSVERAQSLAKELVALKVEAIFAQSGLVLPQVKAATQSIPIVFIQVADPLGAGYVQSMSRPSGNMTGFALAEFATGGKMVELLKEISPTINRVAVVMNPEQVAQVGMLSAISEAAKSYSVAVTTVGSHGASEIEKSISDFAAKSDGGLIVLPNPVTNRHRHLIIALAAQYRLPAIYRYRHFVVSGGLMSYGESLDDSVLRAASYIDRILRGAKVDELPVQQPTKFELVINLKTAKALGLEISPTLLARADEVIE